MPKPGPTAADLAVGARIRLRRKALNLSQEALAASLGLSFQQVQKYERGVNRVSANTLVRIALSLDYPVASLLGVEAGGEPEAIAPAVMVTPGAVELLEVYATIPSRRARASLLNVAKALAETTSDDGDAADAPRRAAHVDSPAALHA